jgi:hypothetical protein
MVIMGLLECPVKSMKEVVEMLEMYGRGVLVPPPICLNDNRGQGKPEVKH